MNEKLEVHEITTKILADLQEQNYSHYIIGRYRHCYNGLQKHMVKKRIKHYSAEVGLDYIRHKYGISIEGFFGKHPVNVQSTIRGLQVLWDYSEYGRMVIKIRPQKKAFECPVQFANDYKAFQDACLMRNYTNMGKTSIFSILRKFLIFLNDSGLASSNEMTSPLIIKFLSSYIGNSTRYIATIISNLRNYLDFLYKDGRITTELTGCFPKVKIMRNAFIPSVWKQEDVQKLFNIIDRNNPIGKRDYALFLLVIRLGLRVGDIRGLKLTDLNWTRKTLSIVMQKTKQPLELPISEEIGWAIIDYLKNGRPQTVSNNVFIRHKAPYDRFGDHNSFGRTLGRYMNKAKIDMDGLRNCVIDPEEVFYENNI
ncbi:MAG: tyrosine-type recombinase/integrase [Lentisphaerota bacterium]